MKGKLLKRKKNRIFDMAASDGCFMYKNVHYSFFLYLKKMFCDNMN